MSLITIIGIAIGLGMDAFAVAIAVGSQREHLSFRPVFRLSFHFGLFQFLMPVIGWLVGEQVSKYISAYDHWVAFALLAVIGGKMIYESFNQNSEQASVGRGGDPHPQMAVDYFIDCHQYRRSLGRISLALLNVEIIYISVIIGVVAAVMTVVGMAFGRLLG